VNRREIVAGMLGGAAVAAAGGAPGAPPPFLAAAHLYFESVEAFQGAFAPHAEPILGDVPNYTNTTPVIQISEVSL